MANVVKLKRSAVQGRNPSISDLQLGEVALNTADGNLFFKKSYGGDEAIVTVATTNGVQTLSNKTFADNVEVGGDLTVTGGADVGGDLTVTGSLIMATNAENIDLSSGAGIIDDQGDDGSSGEYLMSTGQGVRWQSLTANSLSGLTDVTLSGLESGQIIKYNGTVWVNADENSVVTSAVFAANATSDLGPLSDENVSATEDLEPEHETEDQPNGMGDTNAYYNMGSLAIDGVVGLRNVDQSLKSDYISYSIIFGF
jgi:hypothetical protein